MKSAIEYIKEAWAIYTKKENFIFFARIMAVLVVISSIFSFLTGFLYPADYLKNADFSNIPMLIGFIIISILTAIVGLWSQTTNYMAILKMGNPLAIGEKEILIVGFKKIWKYLLITSLTGLIVCGGIILLIIPGIIFAMWYSFATFIVLDKDMKIGEALKLSKSMVTGKFWKILGRSISFGLVSMLVSVILSIIPYIGSLILAFTAPLFLLPFYLLYRDLSTVS